MAVEYRAIKEGDAQALWDMMSALDNETKFMMYEPNERSKDLSQVEAVIDGAVNGGNLLIAAIDNNEIIGYVSAERNSLSRIKHTAYIVTGIREKYRGQGIGTELFGRLDEWAKENNIVRLELTVMCHNTAAIHLYEKNGFVKEGVRKKSMLVDSVYIDEFYMAKLF